MNIQLKQISYHRNGISGAPFYVVIFWAHDYGRLLGIVFDEDHHVAVLQIDKLAQGDIAFGSNSWRGDQFEPALRRAIHYHQQENNL